MEFENAPIEIVYYKLLPESQRQVATFCPNCGLSNSLNNNYCTKCGTKLNI